MTCTTLLLTTLVSAPVTPETTSKPVQIPAQQHPGGNAQAVAISPDGKFVAAGFGGPSNGRFPLKPNGGGLFVWERATGKEVFAHGEYGDILNVSFSSTGRFLAYARIYTPGDSIDDDVCVLIDLKAKKVVKRWRDAVNCLIVPGAERLLVAERRAITVFSLAELKQETTFAVRGAIALTASSNGKVAAALSRQRTLEVLPLDGKQTHFSRADEELKTACAIALSPDGKSIVCGHAGGLATVWSTENKLEPHKLQVDSKLPIYPVFLAAGTTLALATQPANGVRWSYDRTDPSGFKFAKGKTPPTCDLFLFAFPEMKAGNTWQFEDGSFGTIHARFGKSAAPEPEYDPARFAASADGQFLVAGCNGCCIVAGATGKLLRTFQRSAIKPER